MTDCQQEEDRHRQDDETLEDARDERVQ
jgi:hypothetical protein